MLVRVGWTGYNGNLLERRKMEESTLVSEKEEAVAGSGSAARLTARYSDSQSKRVTVKYCRTKPATAITVSPLPPSPSPPASTSRCNHSITLNNQRNHNTMGLD